MKKLNLVAALLLTLSMGLTLGCSPASDAKKEEKAAGERADRGNKNIEQMNATSKELDKMGIYVGAPAFSSVSSLSKSDLLKAQSLLENYISLGEDTANLATSKNVQYAGLDHLNKMVENAKSLRQKVIAQQAQKK